MSHKPKINVEIADMEDADGILTTLKQNLIEIRDADELSQQQMKKLEEE